jgi:two-component system, NarL family, response regulator NreC
MLINAQSDMRVVGEASRTADIPAVLEKTSTDVLVLDLGMPEGSGFQALKQVQASFPATRVIMLTLHNEVALARAALAAGAAGFVLKQSAHPELFSAIRAAHGGGVYIDPSIARGMIPLHPDSRTPGSARLLSEREQEVLRLTAEGYSNHEIAARIHLSTKTVETYRTRITEKLGLRTRAEMTRYALITGLLSAEHILNE